MVAHQPQRCFEGEPRREQPVHHDVVHALSDAVLILAHGLSADPLAKRYGPRLTPPPGAAGPAGLAEVPERRLTRRTPATSRPG